MMLLQMGLVLNVDLAIAAFHSKQTVLQFLSEKLGISEENIKDGRLNDSELRSAKRHLKSIRVRT